MDARDFHTCRFCKGQAFDLVRFGKRHYAHARCGLEKQGAAFLDTLSISERDNFPLIEAKEFGVLDKLRPAAVEPSEKDRLDIEDAITCAAGGLPVLALSRAMEVVTRLQAARPAPLPRGVVAALAEIDSAHPDLLKAWDVENELRHATENQLAALQQEHARLTAAATALLENNGGPTGGYSYFGTIAWPDTHVLTRIEDFKALEAAVKAAR